MLIAALALLTVIALAAVACAAILAARVDRLDRLVAEKVAVLTQQSAEERQVREQVIRQFQQDFGTVTAHVQGLRELQSEVSQLNGLLRPQQLRGELGEVLVRNLLADKLPGQFEEDYVFLDGKQVEFAIRLNGRLIAVDAKFPLDDFRRLREASDERQRQARRGEFRRTLRKKIDEVKAYIKPDEGTYNFAIMVIPSEAVYYEMIGDREFADGVGLAAYASARNVFVASPNTFWAYLSAMAHGLRGLEIERHAEQILEALQALTGKIRQFAQDEFRKLGVHLKDAANTYDEAERRLRDLEAGLGDVERLRVERSVVEG